MAPSPKLLTPYDIIFCCSICQATPTDVYRDSTRESLNVGQGNGISVLLWLTECGHVVCSEHFEDGGVPFHSQHQKPRAPCPVCEIESHNSTPRKLYWLGKDQRLHDDDLPQQLFEGPPAEPRSDETNEVRAWRFDYNKLLRDNTLMRKHVEAFRIAADAKAVENSKLQEKLFGTTFNALQMRIEELEAAEREYLKHKEKLPDIMHQHGQITLLVERIELLQEYIQTLGYPIPSTTGTMEDHELNRRTTHSRGEPQRGMNQCPYRSGDTATAHPQSGAYFNSGSSRTLSDPEPVCSVATHDRSLIPNSQTRGTKRTQSNYVEDTIQQATDAVAMLHSSERQSMPPPPLPRNRKLMTPRKVAAASQMCNLQEQAHQVSNTHPREGEVEDYTMSGALHPESRHQNDRISNSNDDRCPRQTRTASASWQQRDGLKITTSCQPLRRRNPTNEHYAQPLVSGRLGIIIPSPAQSDCLQNVVGLPTRAASRVSAHPRQNSIVQAPQITRAQSAIPGRPFRQESQSARPPTRFRNGMPCTPILSQAKLAVYPPTQSGRPLTTIRNSVLSRAELALYPPTQSHVSRFFSAPAVPSVYHTTNGSYNTHVGSLPARSNTANDSFRMEPNGRNRVTNRSLNSLSFMSNPYTSNNEQIVGRLGGGSALDSHLPSSIIGARVGGTSRRVVRR